MNEDLKAILGMGVVSALAFTLLHLAGALPGDLGVIWTLVYGVLFAGIESGVRWLGYKMLDVTYKPGETSASFVDTVENWLIPGSTLVGLLALIVFGSLTWPGLFALAASVAILIVLENVGSELMLESIY